MPKELILGKTDSASVQSRLERLLNPVQFTAEVKEHLERFEGREWLIADIDEWMATLSATRILLIEGDPGIGKTALSTWLYANRNYVVAFQACKFGNQNRSDARNVVKSIAFQLACRFPDYQATLTGISELPKLVRESNAHTLFSRLILEPFYARMNLIGKSCALVIDALDETTQGNSNELTRILALEFPRTPEWFRLIVTSRPDPEVTQWLQHADKYVIESSDQRNQADIRTFIRQHLVDDTVEETRSDGLVDKLSSTSEGFFLYLEWFRRELQAGRMTLAEIQNLPPGFGLAVLNFFTRRFRDVIKYRNKVRPLLEVLFAANTPLPPDYLGLILGWDDYEGEEILDALGSLFKLRDGVLQPFHKTVIECLTDRSRSGDFRVKPQLGHARLADQGNAEFNAGVTSMTQYMRSHYPSHLIQSHRWSELENVLCDRDYFVIVWHDDPERLKSWWKQYNDHGHMNMVRAYERYLEHQYCDTIYVLSAAELLWSFGHLDAAVRLSESVLTMAENEHSNTSRAKAFHRLGIIWRDLGHPRKAKSCQEQAEIIFRQYEDWNALQNCLRAKANLFYDEKEYHIALDILKETEEICRRLGIQRKLFETINNQATLYVRFGELDAAYESFREVEGFAVENGLRELLLLSLHNQAFVLHQKGFLDRALQKYAEAEDVANGIGRIEGVFQAQIAQASILKRLGDLNKASVIFDSCISGLRRHGLSRLLHIPLMQKGELLMDLEEYKEARAFFEEAENIFRDKGLKDDLQGCLNNLGLVVRQVGDVERALRLHEEQESICREISSISGLTQSLGNQATILAFDLNRSDDARKLLKEAQDQIQGTSYVDTEEWIARLMNEVQELSD